MALVRFGVGGSRRAFELLVFWTFSPAACCCAGKCRLHAWCKMAGYGACQGPLLDLVPDLVCWDSYVRIIMAAAAEMWRCGVAYLVTRSSRPSMMLLSCLRYFERAQCLGVEMQMSLKIPGHACCWV